MPRIYISHAFEDYDISNNLANYLIKEGAEIWIHYSNLKCDKELPNVIKQAINYCDTFLVVWSKWAVRSRCVRLECQTALKLKKTIVPCLYDDTKNSIMSQNFHCINFNNFDKGFNYLVHALKIKQRETNKNCYSDNPYQTDKPIIASLIYRDKPIQLSEDDLKEMLKSNDFFEKNRNKVGDGFKNQFKIQTINHDKIILDHASRLMWQQGGSSELISFEQAKFFLKELNNTGYAHYHDWRLPTMEEAMSLMKKKKESGNNYIDPIFDQTQSKIWTSDLTEQGTMAWVVFFNLGSCYTNCFDSKNYVRTVRCS